MSVVTGGIASLRLASDIAKGFLSLHNMSEVQGKVIELQSAIMSAQSSAFEANSAHASLIEEVRELKKQIADLKAWEAEKQRYKLTAPWTGSLAYALKKSMSNSEPPHYLCTSCYENGRKSILNQATEDKQRWTLYMCPVCKSKIPTGYAGSVAAEYAPD